MIKKNLPLLLVLTLLSGCSRVKMINPPIGEVDPPMIWDGHEDELKEIPIE